jgi:hypothetical protein
MKNTIYKIKEVLESIYDNTISPDCPVSPIWYWLFVVIAFVLLIEFF